jgi:hypothetical protein
MMSSGGSFRSFKCRRRATGRHTALQESPLHGKDARATRASPLEGIGSTATGAIQPVKTVHTNGSHGIRRRPFTLPKNAGRIARLITVKNYAGRACRPKLRLHAANSVISIPAEDLHEHD